MTNRNQYDFHRLPDPSEYPDVVRAAAAMADRFGFVIRPGETHLPQEVRTLLEVLKPDLVTREQVRSWPGTALYGNGKPYLLYEFLCTFENVERLLGVSQRFEDWRNPQLPEDLHFLREDRSVVLGTTAQESFVWAELDLLEYANFVRRVPAIRDMM